MRATKKRKKGNYDKVSWNVPRKTYMRLRREALRRMRAEGRDSLFGVFAATATAAIEAGLDVIEKEELK